MSRAVYADNESLCIAVENAIWHEAERLKLSVDVIKQDLMRQISWLSSMEANLKSMVTMLIGKRHARELACTSRLVEMIGETIEKAEPIRELWLVAPDAISVHPTSLTVPPAPEPVTPSIAEFFRDHLSGEQMDVLAQLVADIKTGSVVLEEDLASLLDRSASPIGPLGTVHLSDSATLINLTFPRTYRAQSQLDRIKAKLSPHESVVGIDEHYGVVDADSVSSDLVSIL